MFAKLMCLCLVLFTADGTSVSGICPRLKNLVEPELDKLSGLWHVVGSYPEVDGLKQMEVKKIGENYNISTNFNNPLTHSAQIVVGVDEENLKVIKFVNDEGIYENLDGEEYLYLLAAEYDNFSILYTCYLKERVHEDATVLSRSKQVDEDTRKKIKSVLQEYPGLEELKNKFN